MEENIQYGFKDKDGVIHKLNVRGASNITEAVLEAATNLMRGGIEADGKTFKVDDIMQWVDIPG